MRDLDLQLLAESAVVAARTAGRIISRYSNQEIEVEHKDGGHTYASQVVTEVDRKAQDAILEILNPSCDEYDFALLTEESEDDHSRFQKDYFWCIDPLDGTLPFTKGNRVFGIYCFGFQKWKATDWRGLRSGA